MKTLVALLAVLVVLAFSAVALADPSSPENGCHGYYTTQCKELVGDRGAQGSAIGGKGNSDGDPTNGQAHSAPGAVPHCRPSSPRTAASARRRRSHERA